MLNCLLDTGIVIRHLRGQKDIVQLLRSLSRSERLAIATITRLEICAGMRPEEKYATRKLLGRFANLSLDSSIAEYAGLLVARGKQINKPLNVPDAIIAATAIKYQLSVLTLNERDFKAIPGLRLYPLS